MGNLKEEEEDIHLEWKAFSIITRWQMKVTRSDENEPNCREWITRTTLIDVVRAVKQQTQLVL